MPAFSRWLSLSGLLLVIAAAPALYAKGGDQVRVGGPSIYVAKQEAAGDLVCIGCSVHMEGSCGDVVVIGGSIDLNGSASADLVAVGGAIRLGDEASVAGDIVTIGGRVRRSPGAVVRGQVSSRTGVLLFVWLVLIPSLPVVLLVALVVWLVSRNRPSASQYQRR